MNLKRQLISAKSIDLYLIIFSSIFYVNCSSIEKRQPNAVDETKVISNEQVSQVKIQNLSEWFQFLIQATQEINESSFNKQTCQNELQSILQQLKQFDFNHYSLEDLKQKSLDGIQQTWNLREAIHNQLSDADRSCRILARDIFHELHDHEDYYGEFAYQQIHSEKPEGKDFQKEPIPILNQDVYAPYHLAKGFDGFQFEPGDLVLARGTSFLSATITQLTDNRSHFSHAVVVVEDSNNGQSKLGTVESYTTTNVKFFDLNYALKNENARLLVLRPKNKLIAQKASQFALQFAKENRKYDFDFNFDDYSKLSCVEVARAAYDLGSDGVIKVPENPAKLDLNNKAFLKRMNFKNGTMITPGDLEFDSNFQVVLDWRDYRLIRDSRYKDVVMSEIVYLMDQKKYEFVSSGISKIASSVVLPSRTTIWWPLVRLITGVKEINPLTPASTVDTMAVLDQVATMMLSDLQKFDNSYQNIYKRPMTNFQLRQAMKKIEQNDLKRYTEQKNSFHQFFKPVDVQLEIQSN